jgi:hypothetical protein
MSNGLNVHNGAAVVQGLLGKRSAFIRTPKVNTLRRDQKNIRNQAYFIASSYPFLVLELGLGILFSVLAINCVYQACYVVVPCFVFIAAGYLMVSYFTVAEMFEKLKVSRNLEVTSKLDLV